MKEQQTKSRSKPLAAPDGKPSASRYPEAGPHNGRVLMVIVATGLVGLGVGHFCSDRQDLPVESAVAQAKQGCDGQDASCGAQKLQTLGPLDDQAAPRRSKAESDGGAGAESARPPTRIAEHLPTKPPVQKPQLERTPIRIAAGDPSSGKRDAPVTIVKFSDFRCGYCGKAMATVKQLVEAYPDKLRVVFKHYPRNPQSDVMLAHLAAQEAAVQGKFWAFQEKLFAHRGAFGIEELVQLAQTSGLDGAAMRTALQSETHRALVESHREQGVAAGLSGTPTFFINGRKLVGAQPIEAFRAIIDEELRR